MSYETEAAAVRTRLNANWSATPIAWPNMAFTPPAGAAWIRPTILPADARQVTMGTPGTRTYRHAGLLIIQVFIPKGTGDDEALELADSLCTLFRGVAEGGVRYGSERGEAPRVAVVGDDGKGWYQVNVHVPFMRDELF